MSRAYEDSLAMAKDKMGAASRDRIPQASWVPC